MSVTLLDQVARSLPYTLSGGRGSTVLVVYPEVIEPSGVQRSLNPVKYVPSAKLSKMNGTFSAAEFRFDALRPMLVVPKK